MHSSMCCKLFFNYTCMQNYIHTINEMCIISIKDNQDSYTLKNKHRINSIDDRYPCAMSPYAFLAHVSVFLCKSKDTPSFLHAIFSLHSILSGAYACKVFTIAWPYFAPPPPPAWVSYLSEYSPLKSRPASFFDSSASRTCPESGVS